jgi:hypothetical protein
MGLWDQLRPRPQHGLPTAFAALVIGSAAVLITLKSGGELCTVDWTVLLEYVKTAVSWPPIVLFIVLYLARKFEANIRLMLDRIRGIKFAGAEASMAAEQELERGQPITDLPGPDGNPPGTAIAVAAPAAEAGAQAAPPVPNRHYSEDLVALVGSTANIEAAIDWVLANPGPTVEDYVKLNFRSNSERIFNIVFGTQVLCTEYLANDPKPHPTTDLLPFFNRHVELGGKADQLFGWIAFMTSQGLIANVGPAEGPLYQITEVGRRFLAYIKQHYPLRWNQTPL